VSGPLRRVLALAKPTRGWIVLAAAASFGALAANIALMASAPYLLSKATLVTGFAALALAVTAVRAFALTRAALRYADRYLSHLVAFRVLTQLRVWLFRSLEPLSPAALDAYREGDLLTRAVSDIEQLDGLFVRSLIPPIGAIGATLVACGFLGALQPRLAICLSAFVVLTAVVVPVAVRRASRRPAGRAAGERAALHATVVDGVHGLGDLIANGRGRDLDRSVRSASVAAERPRLRLATVRALGAGASATLAATTAVALLALAVPSVTDGLIGSVFLASIPLVGIAAFEGVPVFVDAFREVAVARAAAARTFELADTPPVVSEPGSPAEAPLDIRLRLQDVSFAYPGGRAVLDHVDLTLEAGDRVAVAGPSGAGKTTLVELLLRFRDPTGGSITMGGIDLRSFRSDDVRARIGVVPQQIHLFNGTLRDNLLLADGAADDDRLLDAVDRACLGPFVRTLPRGLDTPVGEDGHTLSGGERQRVAIARALLRDAPILILDEATANLDAETERHVLAELDRFARGKSLLVVSHRPAPLELAPRRLSLSRRT
jgi:thiol reductant ABC exporter CydC subunit